MRARMLRLVRARALHGTPDMPREWVDAATRELKQAPRIASRHGVDIKPLYTAADLEGALDRGAPLCSKHARQGP